MKPNCLSEETKTFSNDSKHIFNTEKRKDRDTHKLIFKVYANIVKMLKNAYYSDMTAYNFGWCTVVES